MWAYEKLKEKNVPEARGSGVASSQRPPRGSTSSSFIVLPSEFILPPLLDRDHFEGSNIYWTNGEMDVRGTEDHCTSY